MKIAQQDTVEEASSTVGYILKYYLEKTQRYIRFSIASEWKPKR